MEIRFTLEKEAMIILEHEEKKAISWDFVLSNPNHLIAFGFGSGLSVFAPGSVGTLIAIPIFYLIELFTNFAGMTFVIFVLFFLGVWVCDVTSKHLGIGDYGGIVWDEVVGFMCVLLFVPKEIGWITLAYFLFRIFDIIKPIPAGYIDKNFKSGLGVMLDDLIAAMYTIAFLVALQKIWI